MKPHTDLEHPADKGNGGGEVAGGVGRLESASRVDLSQLAVRRDVSGDGQPAHGPRRRRHLFTRYLLPFGLLLGFLSLVGWSARESLLPSRSVTVMPVLSARTTVQEAGAPLFQAAGWVEPRPTPIVVTALAEGVVERLLVVEDQEVKDGEPVAYLVPVDISPFVPTMLGLGASKARSWAGKHGLSFLWGVIFMSRAYAALCFGLVFGGSWCLRVSLPRFWPGSSGCGRRWRYRRPMRNS